MSEPTDRRSSPEPSVRGGVRSDARAEEAARLLHAARAVRPAVNVTLPEIQAAIRARRYGAMVPIGRMIAVAAIAVFPVVALGAVGISRGWWAARPPATTVAVTAGGTARIGRRGHFTLSLRGPGSVEVRGDDGPIRLDVGQLEIANDGHDADVAVETAGHRVEIAPSSTVAVEALAPGGQLRLETVAGRPPRLDGDARVDPGRIRHTRLVAPAPAATPAPPPTSVSGTAAAAQSAPTTSRVTATATATATARPHPVGSEPGVDPVSSSPAAREVAMIRDALERLRGDNDAAAALRLLDEHDRYFPDGLLRDEARITRIEALLALGRTADALQRLEMLAPALLDRSPRLQVTRGELRATRGHCPEALADVAAVATSQPGGDIERRIEQVRTRCNSPAVRHTGEAGGSR
jgi:hypothetical protein